MTIDISISSHHNVVFVHFYKSSCDFALTDGDILLTCSYFLPNVPALRVSRTRIRWGTRVIEPVITGMVTYNIVPLSIFCQIGLPLNLDVTHPSTWSSRKA